MVDSSSSIQNPNKLDVLFNAVRFVEALEKAKNDPPTARILFQLYNEEPPSCHLLPPSFPKLPVSEDKEKVSFIFYTSSMRYPPFPQANEWPDGLADAIYDKNGYSSLFTSTFNHRQLLDIRRHFIDSASQYIIHSLANRMMGMSEYDCEVFMGIPLLRKHLEWWWSPLITRTTNHTFNKSHRSPFGAELLKVRFKHNMFSSHRKNNAVSYSLA